VREKRVFSTLAEWNVKLRDENGNFQNFSAPIIKLKNSQKKRHGKAIYIEKIIWIRSSM
jgi:hypothetical protein